MRGQRQDRIALGRVVGLHGVRGWVKVYSYTRPRENVLGYSPWQIKVAGEWHTVRVLAGRAQGKSLVAKLEGFDDRDSAAGLLGCEVAVFRSQLPEPGPGDYYWSDLIGLRAVTREGGALGEVTGLTETGSADVLMVHGEHDYLIPYVPDVYVIAVDLDSGLITLDWRVEDVAE